MNAHDYNISTRRVTVDGQTLFEARIQEFPDVIEFAETPAEAYELAIDTIETLAEIHAERGKKLPGAKVPIDDYSGRVTLRLPKDLHRTLAIEADRQDISLNQYLVSALAFHGGNGFASTYNKHEGWQANPEDPKKRLKKNAPKLRIVHSDDSRSDAGRTASGWK